MVGGGGGGRESCRGGGECLGGGGGGERYKYARTCSAQGPIAVYALSSGRVMSQLCLDLCLPCKW